MKKRFRFFQSKMIGILFLLLIWIFVNALTFYRFGIVTGFEANKYIANADALLTSGGLTSPQFLFYSLQIVIIAFSKHTGTFPYLPVLIQLVANLYSTFCFYKIVSKITENHTAALYASACLLGMFYYQSYNFYLFTESLYFSISIIYFHYLIRINEFRLRQFIAILVLLSLLYLTRPVGLFFIPATFIFIILKFFSKRSKVIFSTVGILFLFLFLFLLNNSLNAGGEFDFLLPYLDERIICGVPTLTTPHKIVVPVEKDSIQGLFYIITHYWDLFVSLSFRRFVAFWGVTRPYYSLGHNIYVGYYFYTLYALMLLGIRRWTNTLKPEICFILCIISLTTFTTMLSCDEWHNRFILSILPFLIVLATFSLKRNTNYLHA